MSRKSRMDKKERITDGEMERVGSLCDSTAAEVSVCVKGSMVTDATTVCLEMQGDFGLVV